MSGEPPTLRSVALSALAALIVGLGAVSLLAGFDGPLLLRLAQGIAVFGAGAVVLGGVTVLAMVRLAGWTDPESEHDFEALVQQSERLAREDSLAEDSLAEDSLAVPGQAHEDQESDRLQHDELAALVRSALAELPLEFHQALEHVAVIVADGGRQLGAYGLYQGDTVAQDYFHDRIVIFADTLTRDFGHDPERLKEQVKRTVRHELAHHLGWDERGVRRLGL